MPSPDQQVTDATRLGKRKAAATDATERSTAKRRRAGLAEQVNQLAHTADEVQAHQLAHSVKQQDSEDSGSQTDSGDSSDEDPLAGEAEVDPSTGVLIDPRAEAIAGLSTSKLAGTERITGEQVHAVSCHTVLLTAACMYTHTCTQGVCSFSSPQAPLQPGRTSAAWPSMLNPWLCTQAYQVYGLNKRHLDPLLDRPGTQVLRVAPLRALYLHTDVEQLVRDLPRGEPWCMRANLQK